MVKKGLFSGIPDLQPFRVDGECDIADALDVFVLKTRPLLIS